MNKGMGKQSGGKKDEFKRNFKGKGTGAQFKKGPDNEKCHCWNQEEHGENNRSQDKEGHGNEN